MDNCVNATKELLNKISVRHTTEYIKDNILSHPEHPSLLSIADTLEKYNIETLAVKIDASKLREVPLPGIVQISEHGNTIFVVLDTIADQEASYYNNEGKKARIPTKDFLEKWSGICLLAEKSKDSKEPEIERRLAEKGLITILNIAIIAFFLTWGVIRLVNAEITSGASNTVFAVVYSLLKIIGLGVGLLLLWFEVDQYNPTLQSFCSGGTSKKINCNAVLNSKHAKILNGHLSLSTLVFSYFFGSLGFLVFSGFSVSSLALSSILSLISIPFILFSIGYQSFIIKQRCKFCIAVQAVLVIEVTLVLLSAYYTYSVSSHSLPLLLGLFLLPIVAWKFIKPLLEKEKETNFFKRGLKKIKNNPNVLHGLLSKTRKITNPTENLGISLKNKNARFNVIKVCNPYCGPCAKAHPILEGLVRKGLINLQILFTAEAENEHMAKPVRHFLAIDAFGDIKKTQTALDEWYTAEKKDYEIFSNKYPLNGELAGQTSKINAMHNWCKVENITHTPTIFINGQELPNEYSVEDLEEVLV